MPFVLEGTINGMRPVSGEVTQGKHKGSFWHFISMEVCDPRFGQVYSCQIRTTEKDLFTTYAKIVPGTDKDGKKVEVGQLVQDITGHTVKLLMKGVSGGVRTLPGNGNNATDEEIIQVRFYVAGLKDLGLPKTDDF
ncbi:MAG TPA: hypothetical protein VFV38_00195 [Ktedonobacteraceae bacterium]|nr:hypothetical protein [Ktedonobacteraceae bacterium]